MKHIEKHASTPSLVFFVPIVVTWIILSCCCCCHDALAFAAFTKMPNSLIDDRLPHKDQRNPLTRLSSKKASTRIGFPARTRTSTPKNHGKKSDPSSLTVVSSIATTDENERNAGNEILRGRFLLAMVAMLYGTLNVSLRFVYEVPPVPPTAAALSATRGWLAFLCFLPPLLLHRRNAATAAAATSASASVVSEARLEKKTMDVPADAGSLFRSGIELGLWNFLAQGLLNVGLVSTGSGRASFLTQTSVLFTPLISTLIGKEVIDRKVWFGCLVALVGLVVLTVGGGAEAGASDFSLSLSRGDLFVLGGALSWSMYLFRISILGPKHPDLVLQGVKTGLVAVFYSIWWVASAALNNGGLALSFSSLPSWMTSSFVVWIALFFSAIGPGTIADVLQQRGQEIVSPSEANILLSAEPVFATVFAVLLLGETSSLLEIAGGGLILVAALIASA